MCSVCVLADQTPTPTKFLRNCEEMGLFHELSKNPFEEAFKKAADESKNLDLPEVNFHFLALASIFCKQSSFIVSLWLNQLCHDDDDLPYFIVLAIKSIPGDCAGCRHTASRQHCRNS